MGKIAVAYFKNKQIIRVVNGYKVKGKAKIHATLAAATDSI